MTEYYGDFAEDDTVLIPFNTFDSNDPSASVTITNLADADIKVHKDGGTTQIATDGATVAIDFDGITGNHLVTINTSAHADYSTGSEYAVRIEGTTVDGGTINAWIGAFSIERAGGALALIKAGNLSANVEQLGGVTQSLTDLKDFADAGYDPATNKVQGVVLVDTVTTLTNLPSIPVNWLTAAGIAASALNGKGDWNIGKTGYALAVANWNVGKTGYSLAIAPALASVCTEARLAELDAANLPADVDAIPTTAMRGTDNGATAAALSTAQADLDTITDTDGVILGAAGVALIWNEILSKAAYNIGQSAAKLLREGADLVQIDGAVSDVSPSTSSFDTNLTQVDTFFDDAVLIFSNGAANAGLGKPVSAYLNANGNMTFLAPDDWPVTPVNGDDFVIFATHVHPIAQIQAAILTTQLTEAYAADGAAPTLTEALMLIQQTLGDFAISGTTLTVREVDGATTAATFTLDDGTNPTAITRAT